MSTQSKPSLPPCGRRLPIGAQVVLRGDTLYCEQCGDLLPPISVSSLTSDRRFQLERAVICGGGSALD